MFNGFWESKVFKKLFTLLSMSKEVPDITKELFIRFPFEHALIFIVLVTLLVIGLLGLENHVL